ncbi:hypothetical protein [Oscillibacter sp. GMB15532]|uniref:hypothetical protein n=1 Tax=Oscillibacter sp. GMB15532 TaxID=3230022 RepID=UPI0034DF24EB
MLATWTAICSLFPTELHDIKMKSAGAAEGCSCVFSLRTKNAKTEVLAQTVFSGFFAEKKADSAVHTLLPKGQALRCGVRDLNFFSICGSIIQKTDGDLHNCKSFLR